MTSPEASVNYTPDGHIDPAYKASHPGCCDSTKVGKEQDSSERGMRASGRDNDSVNASEEAGLTLADLI